MTIIYVLAELRFQGILTDRPSTPSSGCGGLRGVSGVLGENEG
jgi:hypothetical protein